MMEWLFRGVPTLSAPLAQLHERKGMYQCEQEIIDLGVKAYRRS
jgi:hypothetical protein